MSELVPIPKELFDQLLKTGAIAKYGAELYLGNLIRTAGLPESLGFEDIAISQGKNKVDSRLAVDTESEIIRGITRQIPLVATNMSTVVNSDFIIKLWKLGAAGIMHRAATDEVIIAETKKIANACEHAIASVGVGPSQLELAQSLIRVGATCICVDVAHGYADYVIDFSRQIKRFSPSTKVIIGNSVNPNMVPEISDFADALKVGIAQGFACETKNTAGCTEKQFSAVLNFRDVCKRYGIPIISDGGLREPADFVKAIAAGAGSVWAGKIFAACPESAAETVVIDGKAKKLYAGMASRHVQNKWKGGLKPGTCPEGGVRYLDVGESAEDLLVRYVGALRTGITYAGAASVKELQDVVSFVRLTPQRN